MAMHMLNGMLASAPMTDRIAVDADVWARKALEFADALIRESSPDTAAKSSAAEFLRYWGTVELTHEAKSNKFTASHGSYSAKAATPLLALAALHDLLTHGKGKRRK